MRIAWYGTASLRIESDSGSVLVDPFGKMPVGKAAQEESLRHYAACYVGCEDILVTHGHLDHIAHFGRFFAGKPVRVYAAATPCRTLCRHGLTQDQLRQIGPGWHGSVAGMNITAWQGRHCRFDRLLIRRVLIRPALWRHLWTALRLVRLIPAYPEHGEILFYEIEENGIRVQIMGSMNLDGDTDYPTGADVLILPLQGRGDQDTYALRFVERLHPKEVWLDHYDNAFPPLSENIDPAGFVRNVEERFGIPCRPMREGEWRPVRQATVNERECFGNE